MYQRNWNVEPLQTCNMRFYSYFLVLDWINWCMIVINSTKTKRKIIFIPTTVNISFPIRTLSVCLWKENFYAILLLVICKKKSIFNGSPNEIEVISFLILALERECDVIQSHSDCNEIKEKRKKWLKRNEL